MTPPYAAPTVIPDMLAATGVPSAILLAAALVAVAIILLGAGLTVVARPR